jgi:DDE superfamily endonuclease
MTGLPTEQVTALVAGVSALVGGWQRPPGRRPAVGLYRAVVLTLFVPRRDSAQDVAGDLFGWSRSTVSRIVRQVRGLLTQVTAEHAATVLARAPRGAAAVDGFIAPTGDRADRDDLFSGKHQVCGMNVQVVADLAGRLLDTGSPIGGSRQDSVACAQSGIAGRWAAQLADGGPGMLADQGYRGCGAPTPYRQPPGRDLSEVRTAGTTALHSLRAAVERSISHLTHWKILDLGYRGRLTGFPDVLRTVTNLEIYRTWRQEF